MPERADEPPFDWVACTDPTCREPGVHQHRRARETEPPTDSTPGDHMRWDYVGPLPPLPLVVPCQPCLGLGRYWDDVGLTVLVCSACNGSGTDEEYADDE